MPSPVPTVFPPYVSITFDFSDWQVTHTEPLPGDQLDAQLITLRDADNTLRDFLRPAFNDDGSLANGTVGPDQLTDAAKTEVGKANADAAAASAAQAAGSAGQAATSAGNAAASEGAAASSAGQAAGSASVATAAEADAQVSAAEAGTSATEADASAQAAAGSAAAAAGSATQAADSATAAAASADAAAGTTVQLEQDLNAHLLDENNPHGVTPTQVHNDQPLWNAAYIYNHPISTVAPNPGDVLTWDAAGGLAAWAIPAIPPGASYVPPIEAGDIGLVLTAVAAPELSDWLPAVDATARSTANSAAAQAATAEAKADAALPKAGGIMTGDIVLAGNAIAPLNPVTLQQLNASISTAVPPAETNLPRMDGLASPGAVPKYSRGDHVHPSDLSRAPLDSPIFTGTPSLPAATIGVTAPPGDSDTSLATTAFVQQAVGAVPGGATVSPTPPTLNPGALWWDSTSGQLYVRYNDGNSTAWVLASNMPGPPPNDVSIADIAPAYNNVGRNLIHNSMFNVWQRGPGLFNTPLAYTADRWGMYFHGDTFSVGSLNLTDGYRAGIGDEAAVTGLNTTVTGTAGAGACSVMYHRMEHVERLSGKTVIVSFWATSNVAARIGASFDQFLGVGAVPTDISGPGQSVAITTSIARYSMTFTIPPLAGKTLGDLTTSFTTLNFWFSAAPDSDIGSGGIGVQTASFVLWGIQCEVAAPGQTQPTSLEKEDPARTLATCQRFFQKIIVSFSTVLPTGGTFGYTATLPVTMRGQPVITPSNVSYNNADSFSSSSAGFGNTVTVWAGAFAAGYSTFYAELEASADL